MPKRLPLLLACVLIGCFGEMKKGKVTSTYDEFRQHTVVQYTALITPDKGNRFYLEFVGVLEDPSQVSVRIKASSDDWQYLKCSELLFLVDGQPVPVGQTTHQGDVKDSYVQESLSAPIPSSSLTQLASSSTVRGRICQTEFTLTSDQHKALANFAYQMGLDSAH